MSILEKARELGEEIASSTELREMKDSEIAMMNDTAAKNLVEEFNEKQRKFMDLRSKGIKLTRDQISEVQDLENRVMENPLIVNFFQKQQVFERVIEQINEIISKSIAGDQACSDECCSTCSGCEG
jgi:cell fate (sporulation/competence/biofilm development) regulator YlbF (YheA/YmcA/DUF963 family)